MKAGAMLMAAANLACLGLASLGLSACAEGYGYAYDYDPYRGPTGHYVSPFGSQRPRPACAHVYYSGPYEDGMRGSYYAGPFCADGPGPAQAFAVVAPGSPIP